MTKQTLRDDFHARFKITDEETGEFIQYAERSDGQSIPEFFISLFQAQLEVLAERVGKEADLLEFDTHAYGNPQTRADHNSMQFGKKLAFDNASSLIRTFSEELK